VVVVAKRHHHTAPISTQLKALLDIAAAFCMYNRSVDGLATFAPTDEAVYDQIAQRIVETGHAGAADLA
jgi:hypothetical protein